MVRYPTGTTSNFLPNFGTVVSSTLRKTDSFCKAAGIKLQANSAVCRRRDRLVTVSFKGPVMAVQATMGHLGQEIPVKKTKRWERLQGQLSYDQPSQQELRGPCRCRIILRKETRQTTNNRILEV